MQNDFLVKKIPIAAFCCLAILWMAGCSRIANDAQSSKESVYDRVLRTGKIRAGYAIYPPYCMKDPNTGKLSGIFVDCLEQAGENLGFKVDWVEEVGWGTMIEGLEADRYDIVPSGVFPNATRAKHADFTIPLFYSSVDLYVRGDDKRFGKGLDEFNSPGVKFSMIDGYATNPIIQRRFPKAAVLSHPQISNATDPVLDVIHKKADASLEEPGLAAQFLRNNPKSVRKFNGDRPVAIFANTMMFKINQPAFKSMMDATLLELLHEGAVDDLIAKYQPAPGVYYPVADPYRSTKPK